MTLLEETFEVLDVNPNGKKFNKVDRIVCHGMNCNVNLILDLYSEVYKLKVNDKFDLVLVDTCNTEDESFAYEYVMHGKVFQIKFFHDRKKCAIFISFGGLLMSLKGDASCFEKFEADRNVYLCIKRSHLKDHVENHSGQQKIIQN